MNDLEQASLVLLKEVTKTLLAIKPKVFNHEELTDALAVLNDEAKRPWEQSPEDIAKRKADELAEKIWLANLDKKGAI